MAAKRTIEASVWSRTDAAIAIDERGRILAWNESAQSILGLMAPSAIGEKLGALFDARDAFGNSACTSLCGLREMIERGERTRRFSLDLRPVGETAYRRFVIDAEGLSPSGRAKPALLLGLRADRRRASPGLKNAAAVEDRDTRAVGLTRRQAQVLALMAEGHSAGEIARDLRISVNTVRKHIQASLRKLDSRSQAQAVAVALQRGLL